MAYILHKVGQTVSKYPSQNLWFPWKLESFACLWKL